MPGSRESVTPRIQSSGDNSTCVLNILPTSSVVYTSVPVHGVTKLGIRSYPSGSSAPEAIPFHSLGLTNRFTPLHRSDPLVLANLLRHWQDLSFLTYGIPIRPFQVEFTTLTDASTQSWGPHMGDSQISGTWTFRLQAPYELFGTHSGNFDPPSVGYSATGPPRYDHCGQHYSSVLYQQTGRDPFPHPVAGGSVPMASNSGHSHQGQAHSSCLNVIADHLSRPNQSPP